VSRAAFLVLAAAAWAQEDPARRPWPQGEGALGNDVYLPVSERAIASLAQGDRALAGPEPDRAAALDAWRRAIAESEADECVPAPRGTESLELAVLRRLHEGGNELAAAWRERFEASAEIARRASDGSEDALARVAREWPRTRAAARACLALADRAHEAGDPDAAASWLERAGPHAPPRDAELAAAIARRAAVLGPGHAPDSSPPPLPGSAARLELESRVPLAAPAPRAGIRAGIAFLRDGRVCVQGADTIHLVDPAHAEVRAKSTPLRALVREFGATWIEPFAEESSPWLLRPATDGDRIALVAGRAARTRGNALLLLEAPPARTDPTLAWMYSDGGFRAADGTSRTLEETLGPGLWEFEPGPILAGGVLIAQLRQWTGEAEQAASLDESAVRAWCFAFDAETGQPRWKTLLAVGPSAKVEIWGARGFARPADPLVEVPGGIFASTGIGAGVFLARTDGRPIRSVRNRRAPQPGARWRAGASIPDSGTLLWAPSDSDRLYALRAGKDADPGEPFFRAPAEVDEPLEAIGARGDRAFFLGRIGGDEGLASIDLGTGARSASIGLPRGERLAAGGIVGASRAVVASDRTVRIFDLARDLYLLDAASLPGSEVDPASGIAARGDRVYVASERVLWILRAR